ncbi:MAG TPA: hypothetical protein VE993_17920 [Stellaceae bacterium]|nr:hypothetical protein [Stellaceae bacterium]
MTGLVKGFAAALGERRAACRTTRRGLLGGFVGLALGASARGRARPPPISQQAAQYQPSPHDGMSCAMCTFFRPPAACAVVAGAISPRGWCKFFDLSD